jgi:hypothetical protein
VTRQAFASADAVLVDLELDAKLIADTMDPPRVRDLIATQLMFLVGQLNGERSVGRHDRAQFSVTTFGAAPNEPGNFAFTYHVKMPVAWGAAGGPPASFSVTLPLRVGEANQVAFAQKYSGLCTDPEGGNVEAGRMFLFFRPRRPGCSLAPEDVLMTSAIVSPSAENTKGKYPEYHRVWADDVLDVVAVFGHEFDDGRADDAGAHAYEAFMNKAEQYVASLDAAASSRRESVDVAAPYRATRLAGTLSDGREVHIETILVGPKLGIERNGFDDWYDARTPSADVIVYSGHAGLGVNVRRLATKGSFVARKYVVMVNNGCDTLAYLDPTLTQRRALLNPDDPSGTKYMDTISNVLGGYFHTGDETSMEILRAFVSAADGAPKKYEELMAGIDDTQIAVVTGEEDNEFQPGMLGPRRARPETIPAAATEAEVTGTATTAEDEGDASPHIRTDDAATSCAIHPPVRRSPAIRMIALFALLASRRRHRRSRPARYID